MIPSRTPSSSSVLDTSSIRRGSDSHDISDHLSFDSSDELSQAKAPDWKQTVDTHFLARLQAQFELRLNAQHFHGEQRIDNVPVSPRSRKTPGFSAGGRDVKDLNKLDFDGRELLLLEIWLTEGVKLGSRRARELFFCGVPLALKGRLWHSAVGNEKCVSNELYNVLRDRIKLMRGGRHGQMHGDVSQGTDIIDHVAESIKLDAPRTFPELTFFHDEVSDGDEGRVTGQVMLTELLEAFVLFRPQIGYAQGMSFLATVLLLFMKAEDAFVTFVNLLKGTCLLCFFNMTMPEIAVYLSVHDELLQTELPKVYQHLRALHISPDMYMINWIMSLFCRVLSLELVTRVWDIIMLDGESAIFRVAVGLLKHLSKVILKCDFDQCMHLFSKFPRHVDANELIKTIRSVKLNKKRFQETHARCAARAAAGNSATQLPK